MVQLNFIRIGHQAYEKKILKICVQSNKNVSYACRYFW